MRGLLGPSALRSRHKKAPRAEWRVADAYLKWLRGRPCYLADKGGCGFGDPPRRAPVEAAHVDHAGGKGMSLKVADANAIPLCQRHHDEQGGKIGSFRNRGGWPTFQIKYGFDAVKIAEAYWNAWPGRVAWQREQEANNG